MAEFVAAAGAAASILQLAAYSQKVVSRVFEFRKNVKETPKAFSNLHVTLPFIQSTASKIKERAETQSLDPAALKDVIPLLTQCETKIAELAAIFKRVIPGPGSSQWNTFWKAVVSVSQDKKVETIAAELMTFVQLLTLHASVAAPTAEEISSIVTADVEDVIDNRIRGIVVQLKESAPSSAITHFNNNSSNFVTGSNQHSYYSGQTQITNHFYFGIRDGEVATSMSTIQNAIQGRIPRLIAASSESHPAADFITTNSTQSLPWEVIDPPVATVAPVPVIAMPLRPRSAEPSYLERDQSSFPIHVEQSTTLFTSFPERVMTPPARQYPAGFIEPMESTASLARSSVSSRSDVLLDPNALSPRSTTSLTFSESPHLSRSGTRASVRSVHSFSSLRPPQPGYFELDAPAASIAVSQLESPRNPRASSFSSSVSDRPSGTIGNYLQSEGSSEPISDTIVVTEKEDAASALESANTLLRVASAAVDSSPSQARQAYTQAIKQYRSINLNDPVICVRKYRSMVNAELGLSLVVADQTKHIARAETHCSTALEYARRSPNKSDVSGVKLDQAKVKARFARLQEKSPRSSVLVIGALHGEAFDLFQEVATELESSCATTDDFNSLAQALLGSARMAKKLSGFGVGDGQRKVYPPDTYLKNAMERIGQAMRRSVAGDPAMNRLVETQGMIRRMLQAK